MTLYVRMTFLAVRKQIIMQYGSFMHGDLGNLACRILPQNYVL